MRTSEFLLCVIDAMGGSVRGRTLLQKTCYFVSVQLEEQDDLDFKAHYYGPYSPAIDVLARMDDLGFVEGHTIGFGAADPSGFEIRRTDYELTNEGKEIAAILRKQRNSEYVRVKGAVDKIKAAGNPGYFELSIAAKTYYIIHNKKGTLTNQTILSEAKQLGWNVEASSLNRAVNFLEELNLIRAS
jgi:uncharacterized protein YwgA